MKCKIVHSYGKWQNLGIRESSGGYHYSLQRKDCSECGKEKFANRAIDGGRLFHGMQVLSDIRQPVQ